LNELDISYLHVFTYSERENTLAAEMSGVYPAQPAPKGVRCCISCLTKKRRAFYDTQLGTMGEVLFEGDIKEGYMHGFTRNYVKVKTKFDPVLVNEVKTVCLTKISPDGDVEITEAKKY